MSNLLSPTDSLIQLLCLFDFCVIYDNWATNIDNGLINRGFDTILKIFLLLSHFQLIYNCDYTW